MAKGSGQKANSRVGLIFNIQRFSLHDGPGIRTTVFFKGCPLSCKWCSNPESMKAYPEIMTYDIRCIKCGKCIESCPVGAISVIDDIRRIDRDKCDLCLECVEVCPSTAIEQVGRYMSVEEVMEEIEKDRLFYLNSGGGVTLSGGEPLAQWEFVLHILKLCKQRGIHTALDTSGYAPWETMDRVLDYVDLVLYDIKHLDPAAHKEGTGRNNELILENVAKTVKKVKTWLRIPVIPDFNDSEAHFERLAQFSATLNREVEKVSLLPYHNWAEQKYERLGKSYPLKGMPTLAEEHLLKLERIIESHALKVTSGR